MSTTIKNQDSLGLLSLPVIVAALGYFVDIYDLTVFSILRVPSLKSLGLDDLQISSIGTSILNFQLLGLILGGILWGILGDKFGRTIILFGSIFTYSVANIACGFVDNTTTYMLLRFIAGVGLAGELGAGITLVAELLPSDKRSYATSIVTGFGLFGAAVAFLTYELVDWRNTYIIGGILGFILLIMRTKILESNLFEKNKLDTNINKGNFFSIIFNPNRLIRYLSCIGVAVPIYFFFGMFAAFSNEISKALNITETIVTGKCVMYYYIGLAIGDFFSGPLSHWLQSRKKVILIMLSLTFIVSLFAIYGGIQSAFSYYFVCFVGGITTGYWAMFMIMTSELFGTNLRATVTTSAPNMVRGTLILMTMLFQAYKPWGVINSVLLVGCVSFAIAIVSFFILKESFGRNLDYND